MHFLKYIKKTIVSVILTLLFFNAFTQNGTEWIVPNQSYYKLKTFQTGVYAVPFQQLQAAGVNTFNSANLQLWYRGKEQAVYLNNDSLFFYGKRNDGALDSLLYLNNYQAHQYYNLLSDTSAYFVTIGSAPGKRITANSAPAVNSVSSWYFEEYLTVYIDQYYRGKYYSIETVKSDYDQGEGWFGAKFVQGNATPVFRNIPVPISNPVTSGSANVSIEVQVSGAYLNSTRNVSLWIGSQTAPDFTFDFPVFSDYAYSTVVASIPSSYLDGKSVLQCNIRLNSNSVDVIAPAYIKVLYPRQYVLTDQANQQIILDNSGSKSISLANVNRPVFILNNTDPLNQQLINYSVNNAVASFNLSSDVTNLYIQNNNYNTIPVIEQVDLSIPVYTNEYNIIYPEVFASSAGSYRQYRSSLYGGSFSVEMYSFEKLCNMFSYGEFSPISIKRFCTEIINANPGEKYLMILGKGVVPSMTDYFPAVGGNVDYRKNPSYYWNNTDFKDHLANFVPTYGEPGSDLMFSIDANYAAQIHTGRVPARSNEEINGYLAKVQIHESLDSNLIWRKDLVHLSGGADAPQIALYKKFVDTYKAYAESPHFGGDVIKSYVKNLQNGSIDDQLIANVATSVNAGLSLMTFFGHSSAEINDVDVGFVSNPIYGYNNTGKYPMLLVNGCTSANIFTNYSFAEDWINTPGLGAINVLGHTDIGYGNNLNQFSTYFYEFEFNDNRYRNRSIGFIHKKIIDSINSVNSPLDIASQAQCTQMNLSGDPALRLYSPQNPDYAIYGDNQTAERSCALQAATTTFITAKDPFNIIIPVDNYGSTTNKTVEITIKRYVNNALVRTYQLPLPPVYYRDSIVYYVTNDDADYSGDNRFEISVDAIDSLTEIRKDNNVAYLEYFMPSSAVKCLYPLNYSVVSTQPVALIAQPTNLLINETDYYFELDTNKTFSTPFKQTGVVTASTLPSWTPQLLSTPQSDSLVYFWRVRFKAAQGNDTLWDNSSFIYIKGSNPGWSQTHIDQHLEDKLVGLTYSSTLHRWNFLTTSVNLKITAVGGRFTGDPNETLLSLDNLPILQRSTYYNCVGNGGLFLFILDKSSLLPKVYQPNSQGWYYCGQNFDTRYVQEISYPFQTNTPPSTFWIHGRDSEGMISAIQNSSKNDFIIAFNDGYSYKSYWTDDLLSYMNDSLKAPAIANLTNGQQPFLLITKRSAAAPISQKVNLNSDSSSFVSIDTLLTSFYSDGIITTPLIGPSSKWGKMYFAIDTSANDITILKLIRYNVSGAALDTLILPKADSLDMNGIYLVDGVHTYCKLMLNVEDTVTLTPARLKKWQIIYNGVPEGSLNPYAIGLDQYVAQTRSEGDTIVMKYRFDNISDFDFSKPIKVVFTVRNESGYLKSDTVTYTILPSKQNLSFTYKIPTRGLIGKNYFQVYVNPQIQPEQYYTNNVIETIFTIDADKTQPVLEVAFDGVRIFDGDLVSASPLINVSLRDNNKYLLMQDPSSIEVFLTYPNQSTPVQITSSNPMVRSWSLDNAKTNTFIAELKPTGLPDGTYTLQVQGKDASGNAAGSNSLYRITFQVENKPTISYFYPYPNPFSTSTRFVFTLSGTTPPSDLKIQIMTVAGTIVKEIFKEQLGVIHIGNNISDYAWDGTDEYGDRLANGVYLYRVVIKDDGQNFEHRSTAGDKAFKHDWGKLYILR
jgi:hypothetical protein